MPAPVLAGFPGNQVWGDGWDWTWIDPSNPQRISFMNHTSARRPSHVAAGQLDWIYLHGYLVPNR